MRLTPTSRVITTIARERGTDRPSHSGGRLLPRRLWTDRGAMILFSLMLMVPWLLLAAMLLILSQRSLPLLLQMPIGELLSGTVWQPMRGLFGFAPFIVGSLAVTALAMVIAVVPAILSAIFLSEFTRSRTQYLIKPLLDLLAGIPSVVYGLWGILFIVPLIREVIAPWADRVLGPTIPIFRSSNPSGYSLLAGGLILAIMVYPFIVSVTTEVLRSIPQGLREALVALGATRWEATKCIIRHSGLTGILAAVALGFSRAFGETLAVMMVVGNTAIIPRSIFDSAYPLPALIANNYGEMMSIPLYESALMLASLMLLVVVLGFNVAARLIIIRVAQSGGSGR
jgi:phosphate transport system permease protein